MEVIAEIGVNHNGDSKLAVLMGNIASACGVDVVKFQYFNADELEKVRNVESTALHKLEILPSKFIGIQTLLNSLSSELMFSYFTKHSLDVGINCFKYAKVKVPADFLVRDVSVLYNDKVHYISFRKEQWNDLKTKCIKELKKKKCMLTVSKYPATFEDYDLSILEEMKTKGIRFGVSDHTTNNRLAIKAKELGAYCIEKHFTLDRNQEGADHHMSIEPKELVELVNICKG